MPRNLLLKKNKVKYGKYLDKARYIVENQSNLKDKTSQKFHTLLIENTSCIQCTWCIPIFRAALNGALVAYSPLELFVIVKIVVVPCPVVLSNFNDIHSLQLFVVDD